MQVSSVNDVRIYELSAGKSLPEWLAERKRRKLGEQEDGGARARIELIQDFGMPDQLYQRYTYFTLCLPDVASCVCMSADAQHIFACGTYKPRVRCYDVEQLSMKFERCVDAEIVRMLPLSDDYEKVRPITAQVQRRADAPSHSATTRMPLQLAFLEEERYIELHARQGRHFRVRMPKFGRDFAYHAPNAELVICASGSEIYRLNLELGRFMQPLQSAALSTTCCAVSAQHALLVSGTNDVRRIPSNRSGCPHAATCLCSPKWLLPSHIAPVQCRVES